MAANVKVTNKKRTHSASGGSAEDRGARVVNNTGNSDDDVADDTNTDNALEIRGLGGRDPILTRFLKKAVEEVCGSNVVCLFLYDSMDCIN